MGFTLSHPAAVVPFARWLPLSALVAGSMAPDIVMVGALPLAHHYGHVWPGLLYLSLPVALGLYLGFHLLAKWPLLALCPVGMRTRLAGVAASGPAGDFRGAPLLGAVKVVAALVLGIATHYAWDTLCHRAGWKPEIMNAWVNAVPRRGMMFIYMQLGTSVLGLAILLYWLRGWLVRAPMGPDAPGAWPERMRVGIITLFAVVAPLVVLACLAVQWDLLYGANGVITAGSIVFMRFTVCSLIAYCCIWWAWGGGGAGAMRLPAHALRAGLAFLLFVPECSLAIAHPAIIDNFGFEDGASDVPPQDADIPGHVTGAVGDGWRDLSSWADVDVDYSIDRQNPHSGQADQAVNVNRVARGRAQLSHPRHFHAGNTVRFSLWLRGDDGAHVNIMLQQARPPWHTYAFATVRLTQAWQEFHVQGVTKADEDGQMMITATQPVHFAIDDVHVEESAPALSATSATPATR